MIIYYKRRNFIPNTEYLACCGLLLRSSGTGRVNWRWANVTKYLKRCRQDLYVIRIYMMGIRLGICQITMIDFVFFFDFVFNSNGFGRNTGGGNHVLLLEIIDERGERPISWSFCL